MNMNETEIQRINELSDRELYWELDLNLELFKYLNGPSDKIIEYVLSQRGEYIQYIHKPSERFQMIAIRESLYAIEWIDNPTVNVQKYAINECPDIIAFINNIYDLEEETQVKCIHWNAGLICFIKNPCNTAQDAFINMAEFDANDYFLIQYLSKNQNLQLGFLSHIVKFFEEEESIEAANMIKKNPAFQNIAESILKAIRD